MQIDAELEARAQSDPDTEVSVVIVAERADRALRARLEAAGVQPTGGQEAFGIVYATMRPAQLDAVKRISGIQSIELDSEQRASS